MSATVVELQVRRQKLRRLVTGLRNELVLMLGEEHRSDIEALDMFQLLAMKGRVQERLMAVPRGDAA